jgi:hypothetical protein
VGLLLPLIVACSLVSNGWGRSAVLITSGTGLAFGVATRDRRPSVHDVGSKEHRRQTPWWELQEMEVHGSREGPEHDGEDSRGHAERAEPQAAQQGGRDRRREYDGAGAVRSDASISLPVAQYVGRKATWLPRKCSDLVSVPRAGQPTGGSNSSETDPRSVRATHVST